MTFEKLSLFQAKYRKMKIQKNLEKKNSCNVKDAYNLKNDPLIVKIKKTQNAKCY